MDVSMRSCTCMYSFRCNRVVGVAGKQQPNTVAYVPCNTSGDVDSALFPSVHRMTTLTPAKHHNATAIPLASETLANAVLGWGLALKAKATQYLGLDSWRLSQPEKWILRLVCSCLIATKLNKRELHPDGSLWIIWRRWAPIALNNTNAI